MKMIRLLIAAAALSLAGACAPERQVVGPAFTTAALRTDAVQTADGTLLPLRYWLPRGEPKAVVLAVHGLNDYGRGFTAPAQAWQQLGIATYAYDQRGHGGAPQRGVWPGSERLAADFISAVKLLRARHPGVPLYALGESMGGGVILTAMARPDAPRLDGVILCAPAVWARSTMPPYYTASLWIAAHTAPRLYLTGRGLDRPPTDNPAVLRDLARDPMVLKGARVDVLWGIANLMDEAFAAAPRIRAPVLLLYGEKDRIVPRQPIELVARHLPPDKRVAVYPRGYHLLLRDLQAAVVHRDVAAWIVDRSRPLPSGADSGAAAKLIARDPAPDAQ